MLGRILLGLLALAVLAFLALAGYLSWLTNRSQIIEDRERTDYDRAEPAGNGFSVVVKAFPRDVWGNGQNRYGYLDAQGRRLTFVKYSEARPFSEGRAWVRLPPGKTGQRNRISPTPDPGGFIDETGREIIPLRYHNGDDFAEGVAIVQRASDGRVGLIDRAGNVVMPFRYVAYYPAGPGGLFPVAVDTQKSKDDVFAPEQLWGYVDRRGREVVRPQFSEAHPFQAGYAQVSVIEPQTYTARQGLIDSTGRVVIPPIYRSVSLPDAAGLIDVVALGDKRGRVNLKHEFVEPLR